MKFRHFGVVITTVAFLAACQTTGTSSPPQANGSPYDKYVEKNFDRFGLTDGRNEYRLGLLFPNNEPRVPRVAAVPDNTRCGQLLGRHLALGQNGWSGVRSSYLDVRSSVPADGGACKIEFVYGLGFNTAQPPEGDNGMGYTLPQEASIDPSGVSKVRIRSRGFTLGDAYISFRDGIMRGTWNSPTSDDAAKFSRRENLSI